jgi:hypothetical protein
MYISVIPAFGSLRQEDQEFKASLDYIARLFLKKTSNLRLIRPH